MKILVEIFGSYILTAVIVSSTLLSTFRTWFKGKTPWLVKGYPDFRIHLIDCRMCTGFWVSLAIAIVTGDWQMFPLVYGASYFLACQER